MPRFLVTLSLGPVQSLIADARRTRDLWCGSWLLSEAARAAARRLHERHPGCLIFPCPDNPDQDLEPQDAPREAANIANILRAEVTLSDRAAVLALCNETKLAAASRVEELGDRARRQLGRPVREDVWRGQIDDILESFAAWVEITDGDGGYEDAGLRLGRTLNARKATRDFQPCRPLTVAGLPKSSLDGARETVLPDWPAKEPARVRLRLSPGEQLDALGVTKRLAGEVEQFTALPRIAADSWIERLAPSQQQRLRAAYEPLVDAEHATPVRGNADAYAALPFDGHLLYPSRLESALTQEREHQAGRAGSTASHALLEAFQRCFSEIAGERTEKGHSVGAPVPYAAILKADGDRMGRLLSRARSAEESRDISRALHRFASSVRRIVREHRGHAVYAGGDDVLALLPLERAADCARRLAGAFSESLGEIANGMQLAAERPTLSVGIGIGYVIEPLGALRALAERAEQLAKGDATQTPRNALAILLRIRSGGELRWRARWGDTRAFEALSRLTAAYRAGELPTRAAYDLRDMDRRLAWLGDASDEAARGMRHAELERLLDRARRDGGGQGDSPGTARPDS